MSATKDPLSGREPFSQWILELASLRNEKNLLLTELACGTECHADIAGGFFGFKRCEINRIGQGLFKPLKTLHLACEASMTIEAWNIATCVQQRPLAIDSSFVD